MGKETKKKKFRFTFGSWDRLALPFSQLNENLQRQLTIFLNVERCPSYPLKNSLLSSALTYEIESTPEFKTVNTKNTYLKEKSFKPLPCKDYEFDNDLRVWQLKKDLREQGQVEHLAEVSKYV